MLVSTVSFVLSTLPELKVKVENQTNSGTGNEEYKDHEIFEIIEIACIAWFTFEYITRFFASPKKLKFFVGFLNIIDLMSILPFFLTLALENLTQSETAVNETKRLSRLISLFKVLRVLRIFKLARHSHGLKSFGYTLGHSIKELALLVFFVSLAVLLFSSLMFFAENEETDTAFKSIPHTFWYNTIKFFFMH